MKTSVSAITLAVIVTVLVTAAHILMKLALNLGRPVSQLVLEPFFLIGFSLMIIGGVLLTLALRNGELSVIHPLLSLGFVWVVIISRFMGDVILLTQYVGIGCIILGVSFISQSRRKA